MRRRIAPLFVGLLVWALPSLAWACPYCASRQDGGLGEVALLGAMILFPFLTIATVGLAIRRAVADGSPLMPDPETSS